MQIFLTILLCLASGLFGWWIADVAIVASLGKEALGRNLPKLPVWKAWALEALLIIILFTQSALNQYTYKNRVYDTDTYEIVYQPNDLGQIDSTSFKIVKK